MSQNSMTYLQRVGIFLPDTRHASKWVANQLRSHYRPVIPAPGLLGRDRPDRRAQTLPLEKMPAVNARIPVSAYPNAQCEVDQCPSCNTCSS